MENSVGKATMLNQELGQSQMLQLVTFELAGEHFGIDILNVQEISQMTKITRVPNAPHYIVGVINLRGKVIPVVDLRRKLDLEPAVYTSLSRIIVINIENKVIGIIVDKMNEVLLIDKNAIEQHPTTTDSKIGENFILGVVNLETKLVILLDLKKVF
ncbi:MAG: chemotaxis protein CheW [Candidatus Kapaibacteriales bacterium]